jgi:hypothetical protein
MDARPEIGREDAPACVADRPWTGEDIVALIDGREEAPKKRGPHRKRQE